MVLVEQKHLMTINRKFWMTVGEWFQDLSPVTQCNNQPRVCATGPTIEKARWFPSALHGIRFFNISLFEIIAGSENNLGPHQKELKNWVSERSHKTHESLRIPVFVEMSELTTKDDLAGLIMNHIILGSSRKMIFLPALPMEYHSRQSLPNRLTPEQMVPVRFPVLRK
jgi:hypothetical protein